MSKYANIHEAAMQNGTVHRALKCGLTMDQIVCLLVEQNEMLTARYIELQLLAPKKVRDMDGQIWIYRAPDALLPEPHA